MLMLRIAAQTTVLYLVMMLALRVVGRRQISQLTVIDLLVILLLGSAVETSLIAGDRSLLAGLVSAGTLLLINRIFTVTAGRSKRLQRLMVGAPILLVHNGVILRGRLRSTGLTEADLLEGLRARGVSDPAAVRFAVMELDGSINVVKNED